MLTRIIAVIILTPLLLMTDAFAKTGLLFNVSATGTPGSVSITLCLNGKGPVSCQLYTVSALNLTITPTIPNHTYPSIGIKINTPGYAISNPDLVCTPYSNGYCLFSASQTQPKTLLLVSGQTAHSNIVTVGYDNNSAPVSYTSTDEGDTWTESITPPPVNSSGGGQLYAVACSGNSMSCAAVGRDNNAEPLAYVSTDAGVNWALSTIQPPMAGFGVESLKGVACSSNGTICNAIGFSTDIPIAYTSTDAGVNWALSATQPPLNGSNTGLLYGIACSGSGLTCTAVGGDSNGDPLAYTSTDGGANWALAISQPPKIGNSQLNGVACSDSGLNCTAVGSNDTGTPIAYTSTDGGVTWITSVTLPPIISGGGTLFAVACSSNGLTCTTVGNDSSNVPLSYTSTDGGITWVASTTQPPPNTSGNGFLYGVTCSTNGIDCSAVGFDFNNAPLTYISSDSGVNWSPGTQPPTNDSGTIFLNAVG